MYPIFDIKNKTFLIKNEFKKRDISKVLYLI